MRTKLIVTAAAGMLVSSICLADAKVQDKTQVHFSGVIGGLVNVFGGRAAREGITSTTYIKGNRRSTVTERGAEIVDLNEEKVYHVDLERKTYTVTTFDELRKQFEEQRARAEKEKSKEEKTSKSQGPEYVVTVDVKDTGKRETISGFTTHQVITTVTVHEKGKTLEESGGSVLTSDMWIGPKLAEMKEMADFEKRYAEKIYGSMFGAAELQQMAVMMATNPAFGKAMKAFAGKKSSFDGTPIRTNLTFEGVAGKNQPQASENEETPTSVAGALGGFLKRSQQRRAESNGENPNRSQLFTSTNEILQASGSATSGDVAIPAGFKLK